MSAPGNDPHAEERAEEHDQEHEDQDAEHDHGDVSYATREEQLREVLDQIRARDRALVDALVVVFGADTRTLKAAGTVICYIARELTRTGGEQ